MTDKQWRMLEVLESYDGDGTIEVCINFGEYEAGRGDDGQDWRLTQFVLGGIVRSLVKKGLARDDADGWGITDRGRELLAKRKSRGGKIFPDQAREPARSHP